MCIRDSPKYAPFFYYLGKELNPKRAFFYGIDIGLIPYSFMMSCKSIQELFLYNCSDGDYSPRFLKRNLNQVYENNYKFVEEFDKSFEIKFNIIFHQAIEDQEQNRYVLETLWKNLESGGHMVIEGLEKNKEYKEGAITFAKNVNKELIYFSTRYGTAILVK